MAPGVKCGQALASVSFLWLCMHCYTSSSGRFVFTVRYFWLANRGNRSPLSSSPALCAFIFSSLPLLHTFLAVVKRLHGEGPRLKLFFPSSPRKKFRSSGELAQRLGVSIVFRANNFRKKMSTNIWVCADHITSDKLFVL